MKISKSSPLHWLYLAAFSVQALLGLCWRPFAGKGGKPVIIFYGHKLNGNLLALYFHLTRRHRERFEPVFLTMDHSYHRQLVAEGINSQWACSPASGVLLSRATALISDHGLHSLEPLQTLYRRLGLQFFDVWHGIPFKGFDADDFRLQHCYDEIWVASDLNRKLYIEQFGFKPERVSVTGYARTDRLLHPKASSTEPRRKFGLPLEGRLVLFAPTWAQDTQGRSIYPFGHSEAEFLGALSRLGQRLQTTFLLRTHLNSGTLPDSNYPNILRLPSSVHPDTEDILLASDMMICDWSSIAFDYLLLDRPVLFLDVPPPFRKGFSLGPEYRYGAIVKDLPSLLSQLEGCLLNPGQYWEACQERHRQIREKVYGEWADGRSAERCVDRLVHHRVSCESSQ